MFIPGRVKMANSAAIESMYLYVPYVSGETRCAKATAMTSAEKDEATCANMSQNPPEARYTMSVLVYVCAHSNARMTNPFDS
jgi:hypothetical protein